jgi:hypothetical protein
MAFECEAGRGSPHRLNLEKEFLFIGQGLKLDLEIALSGVSSEDPAPAALMLGIVDSLTHF